MILDATCLLDQEASEDVPAVFMLRPRSGGMQWIMREEFVMEPQVPVTEYTDFYGNLCQRILIPKGKFHLSMSCRAHVPDNIDVDLLAQITPVEQLPDDVLHFLLPSRYCESDKIRDIAQDITGEQPHTYQSVASICKWIHDNIEYKYGVSDASTTAMDTVEVKQGVCRDFSHLGISLCRSIDVPARMVVGFLHELDPMDLHAWFEAYIGGQWYTFDATQDQPKGNRIIVAYGRDAADVAFATNFGSVKLGEMKVSVQPVKDAE